MCCCTAEFRKIVNNWRIDDAENMGRMRRQSTEFYDKGGMEIFRGCLMKMVPHSEFQKIVIQQIH